MKRYLSLILVFALLLPCLAVPASATGKYDEYIYEDVSVMSGDLNDLVVFFKYVGDDSPYVLWDSDGDGVMEEWAISSFQEQLIFVYEYCNLWLRDILYSFYDYFFTKNTYYTVYYYSFNSTNGLLGTYTSTARGTGFHADLMGIVYGLLNGMFQGFSAIAYHLSDIRNYITNYFPDFNSSLSAIYNYFCVADTIVSVNTWGFDSSGLFTESVKQVTYTSFIADIYKVFDRLYLLIKDLLLGDNQGSSQFDDDMEPVETQIDEWIEGMETSPTVSIEDVDSILEQDITAEFDDNYVTAMSRLMSLEMVMMYMLPIFILCMVGFVLFGKR